MRKRAAPAGFSVGSFGGGGGGGGGGGSLGFLGFVFFDDGMGEGAGCAHDDVHGIVVHENGAAAAAYPGFLNLLFSRGYGGLRVWGYGVWFSQSVHL